MATGAMFIPLGDAFHPERGIGQGDTPSTLIFIAVFDILLTLLDDCGTGQAHTYADDCYATGFGGAIQSSTTTTDTGQAISGTSWTKRRVPNISTKQS